MISEKKTWPAIVACSLGVAAMSLSGCGGGGGVTRVMANGDPIDAADYVGKTFPLLYILGQDDEPEADIKGGYGKVTVIDENTVKVEVPGEDPITFTRVDATNQFEGDDGDGGTITVTIDDNGEYYFVYCDCGAIEGLDFAGAFGFETPVELRPEGIATYDGVYSGAVFATANDPEYLLVPGVGSGQLVADFGTGDISGTLLDASASTDLDDDGLEDDTAYVLMTLENGTITSTGFDGTVTGEFEFQIDGGAITPVDSEFSNTDAEGKFFGNSGQTAAAAYDGDVWVDVPDTEEDINASFEGFFIGTDAALDDDLPPG
jgi:hypothetical protein